MRVSRKTFLSCASVLLLFSRTGLAQNGAVAVGGLAPGVGGSLGAVTLPYNLSGVPYSAARENESIQTLGDGTHIIRKTHTGFWRDSQARTRTEMFAPDGPGASQEPTQIIILDPVEGVQYFLNPRNHSGTRNAFPRPSINPPPSPKPPNNPTPPPPARSMELIPLTKMDDLGMDMIEGVWARGTRQTITFPVNSQGNDRPIVVVNENWFSEELQMLILSKRSDPRYGESTERLTNIERSEPDPSLFRPPAGYTITEPQHP